MRLYIFKYMNSRWPRDSLDTLYHVVADFDTQIQKEMKISARTCSNNIISASTNDTVLNHTGRIFSIWSYYKLFILIVANAESLFEDGWGNFMLESYGYIVLFLME